MTKQLGIPLEEARRKVLSGAAMFVCAHEDDERFGSMRLKGAISLNEFQKLSPSLARDQEIIFYY